MSPPDGDGVRQNGHAAERNGAHDGRRPIRMVDRPNYGTQPLNPDQGCVGCLIVAGILLATFAVWGFIYWYNEPAFHAGDGNTVPSGRGTIRRSVSSPRPSAPKPQGIR